MMADSNKNNTQHGGVDGRETSLAAMQASTGKLDESHIMFNRQASHGSHDHDRLQSPNTHESGYNTESSPATTSSAHGTPGQHFDFDDIIPRSSEMSHDSQREINENNPPSSNTLGICYGSRAASSSFQDINYHDDEETEDDELTSSEERYMRERNQHRKFSLRRRHWDSDCETTEHDDNVDIAHSLPVPVFGFHRLESHESQQSDQNSPPISNLRIDVNSTLHQFLGQDEDVMASSTGFAWNPSETSSEAQRRIASENRRSLESEPQVFRLSFSSDDNIGNDDKPEETYEDVKIDGDYEDDEVFTFDTGENLGDTDFTGSQNFAQSGDSRYPSPIPQSSLPGLRNSAHSSPNIVVNKPPISPSYLSSSAGRRRRHGLPNASNAKLQFAVGGSIPHLEMSRSFDNSTQTPHMASAIIQDVLSTPVPLPNEARGTVAGRLRRLSENGIPMPPSPVPLPDIVPHVRDRSMSAPDVLAMARRRAIQTGRLVGRELRQMSDEYNLSRRNSVPSNTDLQGQASSFPGVRPLLNFMRVAMRSRRSSSVDHDDDDDDTS